MFFNESILVIALASFCIIIIWRITKGWIRFNLWGPSLAIYKFSINEKGDSDKIFEIYARTTGLVSWLLKKANLETDFQFYATPAGYYYYFKTPFSTLKEFIPYTQIAGTSCGYTRDILVLRLALILFTLFLIAAFEFPTSLLTAILFVLSVICIVIFIYSKRIVLVIETTASEPVFVRFSEGILDNVKIGLADIAKVASLINKNIVKWQMRK